MNSLLSPEGFAAKQLADAAQMRQVAQDNNDLITQHNTVAQQIVDDLTQIESDLDVLKVIKDQIGQQGADMARMITGQLNLDVKHYIPTIAKHIHDAKNLILNG